MLIKLIEGLVDEMGTNPFLREYQIRDLSYQSGKTIHTNEAGIYQLIMLQRH